MSVDKINLAEKFAGFNEYWRPRVIAALNGQEIKVVKFQGPFVWHHHEATDELFLVIKGEFVMEFRDREVRLGTGELIVIPKGVEHRPNAATEVEVLLIELADTVNTGTAEESNYTQKQRQTL